jgi:hypothetical protein
MSAASAVMATVLAVFFLFGVGTGILVVMAVSARRADRAVRQIQLAPAHPGTWPYRPAHLPAGGELDRPAWWPARNGR